MTSRLGRWTTLLVTFAGIGLPWLLARRAFDVNDPITQGITFLPAPYALIIWAPIYTGFLRLADTLPPEVRYRRTCFLRRLTVAWAAVYTVVTPVMIWSLYQNLAEHLGG